MRINDLKDKNVLIWGTGLEGQAAIRFIHHYLPEFPLTVVDESPYASSLSTIAQDYKVIRDRDAIARELENADIIIKSPGVSLYHTLLEGRRNKSGIITSLINLWIAQENLPPVLMVTGTKGKSTTASLIHHCLSRLGYRSKLYGNIGVPLEPYNAEPLHFIVMEISSYQAANYGGTGHTAILTSLYPEHLDWHRSLERYYCDKLRILEQASFCVLNAQALPIIEQYHAKLPPSIIANQSDGLHTDGQNLYDRVGFLGKPPNAYLSRPHNLSNVALVLALLKNYSIDPKEALAVMHDFRGLPHRQFELGSLNSVLYVDDSISTTPQSAIAALSVYQEYPTTIIVGGYDRGLDHEDLVRYIIDHRTHAVICMGQTGHHLWAKLSQRSYESSFLVPTMSEAVPLAQRLTPPGGVILLSPAASSFGLFRDYIDRGRAFAREAGFPLEMLKDSKT